MPDTPTWEQIDAGYRAELAQLRCQARRFHSVMVEHVLHEAKRTGADIQIAPPRTVLAKEPQDGQIAVRLDVTEGTALYARQPHVPEMAGDKHRSWRITLDDSARLSDTVRNGLSRMVELVARLQGRTWDTPQRSLDLD